MKQVGHKRCAAVVDEPRQQIHRGHEERTAVGHVLRDQIAARRRERVAAVVGVVDAPHHHRVGLHPPDGQARGRGDIVADAGGAQRVGVGAEGNVFARRTTDVGVAVDQQHRGVGRRDKAEERAAIVVRGGVARSIRAADGELVAPARQQIRHRHLMLGDEEGVGDDKVQRGVRAEADDGTGRLIGGPSHGRIAVKIPLHDRADDRRHKIRHGVCGAGQACRTVEVLDANPVAVRDLEFAVVRRRTSERRHAAGEAAGITRVGQRACEAVCLRRALHRHARRRAVGEAGVDEFDLNQTRRGVGRAVEEHKTLARRGNQR